MRTGMKLMCILLSILFVSSILCMPVVSGDRGGVPINHIDIDIHEPGQKAIICWDGTDEILILSTDMRADSATKVLEIMPLPSEPAIKTVNESIFEKFEEMVEERSYADEGKSTGLGDDRGGDGETIDVDIIFHEKLGVHNLTVIKAYSKEGFASFVAQFMDSIGLEPMSFPEAEEIADAYIQREILYFVLDVVELTTEIKSPEPLMYRFESDGVYYPMEITTLTGGRSHILLFILTPYMAVSDSYEETEDYFFNERIVTYRDEKYINIETPSSPVNFKLITHVKISSYTLEDYAVHYYTDNVIDDDMNEIYEFFKGEDRIKVGVYEYDGPVEMEGDIYIKDYSVHKVEVDEEYQVKTLPVLMVIMIPPIVLVLVVIVLVLHLKKKMDRLTPPRPPTET